MRRVLVWATLAVYGLMLGCSSVHKVPVSEAMDSPERVKAVVFPSGEVVTFNDEGGVINTYRGTIDGVTTRGKRVSIPLEEGLQVQISKTDTGRTVVGIVVGLGLVVAAGVIWINNW